MSSLLFGNNDGRSIPPLYLDKIEASYQPLDFAFHPTRPNLLVAGLVDGSVEIHDFHKLHENDEQEDEQVDSLLSSLSLHTQRIPSLSPNLATIDTNTAVKQTTTEAACKCVAFSIDGTKIISGGSAGDLLALDAERACTFSMDSQWQKQVLWNIQPATEGQYNPITVIQLLEHNPALLATGDDGGGIRVWDQRICKSWSPSLLSSLSSSSSSSSSSKLTASNCSGDVKLQQLKKSNTKRNYPSNQGQQQQQQRPSGCVLSWKEHDDYISAIQQSTGDEHTLLATSADCRLGVYDLRMNHNQPHTPNFRLSDDQEDELLSLQIMKHGKKVVCGTQEGVLSIFSWGTWGDCSDRYPGHPRSIDALLKVDEDTLLTGSSDGQIRVVQIQPDKLLGKIGDDHDGLPIEKLAFNSNHHVVGSLTHSNFIRLWDAKILLRDDDDDDDDDDESGEDQGDGAHPANAKLEAQIAKKTTISTNRDGDDDWDDMDNEQEDNDNNTEKDDSDDSDTDSDEPVTLNEQRKKRLKTDNEKFFQDL
jgi:WD40 repeat protein